MTILSIKDFFNELQILINEKKYLTLDTEAYLKVDGKIRYIDAILLRNKECLAIFEFKEETYKIKAQDFWEAFLPPEISFKFLIITNGQFHKVLNRYSDEIVEFQNSKDLLTYILKLPSQKEIDEIKIRIASEIEKSIVDFFKSPKNENHPFVQFEAKLKKHFLREKIIPHLRFDKDGQFFHLSTDIRNLNSFENRFFKLLIQDLTPGELIYRYTLLETVFATIDYKSIRLNGIVGMNDTSEVGYVETYLDKNFIPYHSPKDIENINKRFILCGSTLSDDLMQWRLYGDDCKGACLIFSLKANSKISGLQLRKINYGIPLHGKNYHPELELIRIIINTIKQNIKQSFQFRALSIWKHFFKSFEYAPEQEVRLLLILSTNNSIKGEGLRSRQPHSISKKWCLTNSHKIVNPFVTIDIDDPDLPFELKEIVLGTKCSDRFTNKKQLEVLLGDKNMKNVSVKISSINNYR